MIEKSISWSKMSKNFTTSGGGGQAGEYLNFMINIEKIMKIWSLEKTKKKTYRDYRLPHEQIPNSFDSTTFFKMMTCCIFLPSKIT